MSTSEILYYVAIASMSFTGVGLILRYALKSKCTRISLCCGLFVIDRDTEAEERIEECKITHNITTMDSNNGENSPYLNNVLNI